MNILDYLIYILECMGALTGIILLFSIMIAIVRNNNYQKQRDIIEIQKMIDEVNKNRENQDK